MDHTTLIADRASSHSSDSSLCPFYFWVQLTSTMADSSSPFVGVIQDPQGSTGKVALMGVDHDPCSFVVFFSFEISRLSTIC